MNFIKKSKKVKRKPSNLYFREYYKNNKEKILAIKKKWRDNNKQKEIEYRNKPEIKKRKRIADLLYRQKNNERLLQQKKEYYQKNRIRLLEYQKNRRKKQYERGLTLQEIFKRRNQTNRYYYSHPEFSKKHRLNRRLKTKELTTKLVQEIYEENIKRFGTLTCYLCEKPILFGKDHIEHKIPISRGGTNEKTNLEISCSSCNSRKSNKTVEEFLLCEKK